MFGSKMKAFYVGLLEPVTRTSLRLGVHPHVMTIMGFLISIIAAGLFSKGWFQWAGLVLFIGGSFDILDGHLARVSGMKSVFGALLDSTLDRYAEIAVFMGIGAYFLTRASHEIYGVSDETWVLIVIAGLGGSLMVSYVRARAEGLGQDCTVGIMQRPERVIALGLGALLGETYLSLALVLIAVVSNYTAFSRLFYIWKKVRNA